MRVAINLICLVLAITIGNVGAAMSTSHGWSSLAYVVTCFLIGTIIAYVITSCELRSSWLAFIVTTSIFLLLAATESESLANVMQHIAQIFDSWKVLPPENSSLEYKPVERFGAALSISCPPIVGVAAAFVAIVFFPGHRQVKVVKNEYKRRLRMGGD